MSKAKFAAAKEMIDEKQYDQARSILNTIDHPMAREWLTKLDGMKGKSNNSRKKIAFEVGQLEVKLVHLTNEIESRAGQQRAATIVFIFCLVLSPVGLGLIFLPFSLFNYFRHKRAVKALQGEKETVIRNLAVARADLYQ